MEISSISADGNLQPILLEICNQCDAPEICKQTIKGARLSQFSQFCGNYQNSKSTISVLELRLV